MRLIHSFLCLVTSFATLSLGADQDVLTILKQQENLELFTTYLELFLDLVDQLNNDTFTGTYIAPFLRMKDSHPSKSSHLKMMPSTLSPATTLILLRTETKSVLSSSITLPTTTIRQRPLASHHSFQRLYLRIQSTPMLPVANG